MNDSQIKIKQVLEYFIGILVLLLVGLSWLRAYELRDEGIVDLVLYLLVFPTILICFALMSQIYFKLNMPWYNFGKFALIYIVWWLGMNVVGIIYRLLGVDEFFWGFFWYGWLVLYVYGYVRLFIIPQKQKKYEWVSVCCEKFEEAFGFLVFCSILFIIFAVLIVRCNRL